MKKADLKTGMLAKARNGYFYLIIVMDDEPLFANVEGSSYVGGYRDDLTNENCSDFDVIEVYGRNGKALRDLTSTDTNIRKLLWEREESKEMTVEQIQKELGYKIKVVEG